MKLVVTGEVSREFLEDQADIEETQRLMALSEGRHGGMENPIITRIKVYSAEEQFPDPDLGYLNAKQLHHFVVVVRDKTW